MGVSDWSGTMVEWGEALAEMKRFMAPAFKRIEQQASASAFINGLLSRAERKTGWKLAEEAGFARPYRLQSLLGRSLWSAEVLCDRVRSYVIEALGDADGVLVVDETGFVKKGEHSVGVARQYSGTAGRVENCQVGVFAAYASRFGHALVDRRLYLPKGWAEDRKRREKAGVPDEIVFATKPAIARELVARILDEGVPCAFVLADALYGSDHQFRRMLEQRTQAYVLAIRSNHVLRFLEEWQFLQTDPATLVGELEAQAWQPLSAGEGAKGVRLYEWVRLPLKWQAPDGFARWLLARKSLRDPEAIAYYFAFAPSETTLAELAGAAGLRWTIEECFLRAKDDLGLDHCEARSWHGWNRHMSLVMAAAAFLARLSAQQRRSACAKRNETSPACPARAA